MKNCKNWVLWKLENGKKVPYQCNLNIQKALPNKPGTWGSYSRAQRVFEGMEGYYNGLGFVISLNNPFVCIDIDNCIDDDGRINQEAQWVIAFIDSYTELSPSGTGIHIWMKADKKKLIEVGVPSCNNVKPYELYYDKHFMTVTGKRLDKGPIQAFERTQQVIEFYKRYLFREQQVIEQKKYNEQRSPVLTDDEIIQKALKANNGADFKALWDGNTTGYQSGSEADLALCNILTFYTQDEDQIKNLWRKSGLWRDKSEKRIKYTQSTINKALQGIKSIYIKGEEKKMTDSTKGAPTKDAPTEKTLNYTNSLKDNEKEVKGNDSDTEIYEDAVPYPDKLNKAAFRGLAGDIVKAIMPYTEADPAAILFSFLTAMGNILDKPYMMIGPTKHYLNLFTVLVGKTGQGRKGDTWNCIENLIEEADPNYKKEHIRHGGLSSGEGLVYTVRDAIYEKKPQFEGKGRDRHVVGYEDLMIDEGIVDKRLLIIESEFASPIRVMAREGNILSQILRNTWDHKNISTMNKNNPCYATNPHISIIGHITKHELTKKGITENDILNGFANRFLWTCCKRSKILPNPEVMPISLKKDLVDAIKEVIGFWQQCDDSELTKSENFKDKWDSSYRHLTRDRKECDATAILSRGEAQVARLSNLYAAIDRQNTVDYEHLQSSLAVWQRSEDSTQFIFGSAEQDNDPVSEKIYKALSENKRGLTQTEISVNIFNRHESSNRICNALQSLSSAGKITFETQKTEGRSKIRWFKN